jgi:LemA protein
VVRDLNILIQSFPSSIIANRFQFTKGEFFELNATDREVPVVSL